MTFTLQTSGELKLLDLHDRETGFPEKGLLILAYLLTSGEGEVARARISRLVWGADDLSRGLTNLRQTATRITARQKELGAQLLEFTQSHVRLVPGAVTCDVEVLMDLQAAGPDEVHQRLGKAITFYRYPFLSEIDPVTPDYRAWIVEMQHRCCEIYTSAIRMAAPLTRSAADEVLVREAAMRVFRYDPDNIVAKTVLAGAPAAVADPVEAAPVVPVANTRGSLSETRAEGVADALGLLRAMYQKRKEETSLPASVRPAAAPVIDLAPLPRLAILPPGDEEGGIVSAFLEDVTIGLCSCRTLRIVAPYTAQRISRQNEKAETIIRHSINYVLDTRITADRGDPSLFAQLIYVANDEVVWADRYRLDPSDFMAHRREIARQVVTNISAAVGRNEETRLYFEEDPAAYFHFLEGQKSLQRYTLPDIRRARKSFRAALQEKQDFGPALSGLARTNHLEWLITARGEPELLHSAEVYAKEAIQRSGDLTSGYRELGVAKLFLGAFDESVDALMTAERLSPQYADVLVDFGDTLVHSSRPAEGLVKLEKAIELNPVTPDGYLWAAAGANYYLEDYSQALRYIERMADPTPALRLAAACRAMQGEIKQAKSLARRLREHYPDFEVDQWISVLPIKEEWQREHYREGLKKAGL